MLKKMSPGKKLGTLLGLFLCLITGALIYLSYVRPVHINVSRHPIVKIQEYGKEFYCMDSSGSIFSVSFHPNSYKVLQTQQISLGNSIDFEMKSGRFFYSSAYVINFCDLAKNKTLFTKRIDYDRGYVGCIEPTGEGRLFVGVVQTGAEYGRRILDGQGNVVKMSGLSPSHLDTSFEEILCSSSPQGKYLSIWDDQNGLSCYDTLYKKYLWTLTEPQIQRMFKRGSNVPLFQLQATKAFVAVGEYKGGKVALMDINNGKLVHVFNSPNTLSSFSCLSEDDSMLAVSGDSGFILIWNTRDFGEMKRIKFPRPVTSLTFSKDNLHLIFGDENGGVTQWPL